MPNPNNDKQEYDEPGASDLRSKFHQNGKVVFLLTRREVAFLKSMTDAEMLLSMRNRRPGLSNRLITFYYVLSSIFKTLFAGLFYPRLLDVFGLYATDKEFIRNIHKKTLPTGLVELTYYKKNR